MGISYYDENLNFISGKEGTDEATKTNEVIYTDELQNAPNTAKYVRFSSQNNMKSDYIDIFSENQISITDINIKADINTISDNFNNYKYSYFSDGYIATDGYTILNTSKKNWKCTIQYIPIDCVYSISISLWLHALGISYYDENLNFISGKEGTGTGLESIDTSELNNKPSNAKYVRFSINRDRVDDNIILTDNSQFLSIPKKLTQTQNNNYITNQWKGKRCAFIGDSISDPSHVGTTKGYWEYLSDILGIVSVSYGKNGAQSTSIISQANSAKSDEESNGDYNAIFILMGTNDFNADTPIGDWYTVEDKKTNKNENTVTLKHRTFIFGNSTFKSRLNSGIQKVKKLFPKAEIIIMTPLHRAYATFGETNKQPDESFANSNGNFISDYVDAVKESANVWSIQLIDLNSISGLFPLESEYNIYFHNSETDLLHPNANGHYRIAQVIAYKLLSIPSQVFPE